MFTFTSFSPRSSAMRSRIGETAWQGPHHSAQKSTRTGSSLFSTSWSKVDPVTAVAIAFSSFRRLKSLATPRKTRPILGMFPGRIDRVADGAFTPLPSVPDHPALEHEVLEWWDSARAFERLREQNSGGPRWHFLDGPITANNPMGVHHAWGRTLKDVFQRYKALRGFDQRYQNGFDCQGLWVEVEVEKSLGLNSKRDIEEYGLAEFADRCIERVADFAGVLADQSERLGMWMDWPNS